MLASIKKYLVENSLFLYTLAVLLMAVCVYFPNYNQPNKSIWDEAYFIPAAQKYVHGVAFLQDHPPLGKLFIALGEKIFNGNTNIPEEFLTTEYSVENIPGTYNYTGARFFPIIFGILAATLFFWLLCILLQNNTLAFFFSLVYLFDNAIIVDTRAALLQSTQLFFIFLALIYFMKLWDSLSSGKPQLNFVSFKEYFILGLLVSLPILVKVNGLFLVLCFVLIYLKDKNLSHLNQENFIKKINQPKYFKGFVSKAIVFISAIILSTALIYGLHGLLGKEIHGDTYAKYINNTNYKNSLEGQENLTARGVLKFYAINILYIFKHHINVESLNPSNYQTLSDPSFPITWPIGARSVIYAYEYNSESARYIYLQGNPVSWLIGLLGMLLSIVLILSKHVFGLKITDQKLFEKIKLFLALYLFYMIIMFLIPRAMYLYHYLIPLTLSYILAALIFQYTMKTYLEIPKVRIYLYGVLSGTCFIVFATFLFFSPLTYYIPITDKELSKRQWVPFWQLESAKKRITKSPEETKIN